MGTRALRVAVLVGGPFLGVLTVLLVSPWERGWVAWSFFAVGALVEAKPVQLRSNIRSSITPVVTGLAILVGGTSVAVAVGLGASITAIVQLPSADRRIKGSYNFAMFVLSTYVAATCFMLVAGSPTAPSDDIVVGPWLGAIVVAQLAHLVVNATLLAAAMTVTGGPRPENTLLPLILASWWSQATMPAIAIVAYVVLVGAGPVGLMLLVVPVASAHRSMAGVESQRTSLDRAVRALVRLVEAKDRYTRGHAERVAALSDQVAQQMGLPEEDRYWIRIGAVLHDVGKVGVPIEVLNKPGGFTADEHYKMRRHPDLGADLLVQVEALEPVVPLVRQHHERIDGCGYPRGLAADQLPLSVRIISAVDSWDAMTTTRPYRTALPVETAVDELRAHSGTQFDGEVVETLIGIVAPDLVAQAAPLPAEVAESVIGPVAEPAT